jgi:tetratricopeptide (TPR) repeat protein
VKQLSIIQAEGRPGPRDQVVSEFRSQARARHYFQVRDRRVEGITVAVVGGAAELVDDGQGEPLTEDEIAVRVDVTGWDVDWRTEIVEKEKKDADGKVIGKEKEEVGFYEAEVVLSATLFTIAGKTFMAEGEYKSIARHDEQRDMALREASRQAVSKLLADITPRSVTHDIQLDDEDKAQAAILKMAQDGNLKGALAEMRGYAAANPDNPSAAYNLAVLLDATGRHEEALVSYYHALSLDRPKRYYSQTRDECARRLANTQALAQDGSAQ